MSPAQERPRETPPPETHAERRDRGDITGPFPVARYRRRTDVDEVTAPTRTAAHRLSTAKSCALHTTVAVLLTVMLAAWTVHAGAPPAVHPRVGTAMLVLHFGALLTAWLAYGASRQFILVDAEVGDAPTPQITAIQVVSGTAFLANCAMLVASVLA